MATEAEQLREEWKALATADTLHMLPTEALIATIRDLADRLLNPAMSSWTINGEPQSWEQMYEREHAERLASDKFKVMVSDLDRCPHGRHEGDVCSGTSGCDGPSKGNPHLKAGNVIGYTIYAAPYTVPPPRSLQAIGSWRDSGDRT